MIECVFFQKDWFGKIIWLNELNYWTENIDYIWLALDVGSVANLNVMANENNIAIITTGSISSSQTCYKTNIL